MLIMVYLTNQLKKKLENRLLEENLTKAEAGRRALRAWLRMPREDRVDRREL
jgi:hypothetical protein